MEQNKNKSPRYLYKYFSLKSDKDNIDRIKSISRIFTHNELYFSRPDQFNDPFDFKALLTLRGCHEDIYRKFVSYHLKNSDYNLNYSQVESVKQMELVKFRKDKISLQKRINKTIKEELDESTRGFRVLCLSKDYKDILMWSHYADGHKGFVVQFNTKALIKNFRIPPKNVIYPKNESWPSIEDFNNNDHEELFLKVKSSHWSYEKEWRIILLVEDEKEFDKTGKVYTFENGLITGIILGCEMSDDNKKRIKSWRNNCKPKPKMYNAIKNDNFYAIKTEPPIVNN